VPPASIQKETSCKTTATENHPSDSLETSQQDIEIMAVLNPLIPIAATVNPPNWASMEASTVTHPQEATSIPDSVPNLLPPIQGTLDWAQFAPDTYINSEGFSFPNPYPMSQNISGIALVNWDLLVECTYS
jgi:hypothetical protein